MAQFFGDKHDNPGGGTAATRLFGHVDIEDTRHPHPVSAEGENTARYRKALSELRGGMLGCYPIIGVAHLEFGDSFDRGIPIPHIGHDCRCGAECDSKPATAKRYFGINVLISGKADMLTVFGGYELLGGKAVIYITGGTFEWMGTHPLQKVSEDSFEDL